MSEIWFEDLISRLKAARTANSAPTQSGQPVSVVLGEALESAVEDRTKRAKLYGGTIQPVLSKLLRTPDLVNLRFGTLVDRMEARRNRQTPFLNFLESQGAPMVVNDYQLLWNEDNIGTGVAEVWNMENALPSEVKGNRPRKSNTLTCVGNTLNVSLIAQEMGVQQGAIDLMGDEIDKEMTRIRRLMNSLLLSSTENTFEGEFGLPTLGGFISRSTDYSVSASGGDLTRTLIQGRVDAIANDGATQGFGYGLPLLGFTNARQLQVLRDIIISEYAGIDPMSRLAFEDELRSRLRGFNVDVQMVFETMPGPVIPFVLDSQLPSGTTIIFDADRPRLAKMKLNGAFGPWVMTRPTERLQTLNVVFDLFTLYDPLTDTRAVISSHS